MATVKWAGGVQNGAIPLSMLASIGTYDGAEMLLNPAAAVAYKQWAAEWKRQEGSDLITDEANRTLARQQYLYNGYINHLSGFYVAAVPGTSSHGEALAVDILSSCYSKDANQHDRLVAMGLKYGWSWYTVGKPSGESWHFNYTNDPLGNLGSLAALLATSLTETDDDMPLSDEDLSKIVAATHDDVIAILRSPEFRDQIVKDAVNRAFADGFPSGFLTDTAGAPLQISVRGAVDATRAIVGDIKNKTGA